MRYETVIHFLPETLARTHSANKLLLLVVFWLTMALFCPSAWVMLKLDAKSESE